MTYKCRYRNNPIFPYPQKICKLKKKQSSNSFNNYSSSKNTHSNSTFSSNFLSSFLAPIEKMIGRKMGFDDIILVALIYLLYTEKDNDNTTLLLCLIFVLLG